MIDLTHRSRTAEMMDAPDIDPAALDHAMGHLEVINRLLNGYGPSLAGIARVLPPGQRQFTLLDVGCGSGDTLRRIASWARSRGLRVGLVGIELCEGSARRAAQACAAYPEIQIRHADIFSLAAEECFDVVHCALMLHHFSQDADAVRLLQRMAQLARIGVVVNDLHRHALAYHSIALLTRIFSRSVVLQNDAPLSVARAFTKPELGFMAESAGLPNVRITWHWAFRWLLTARRAAS